MCPSSLLSLFETVCGSVPETVTALPPSGSNRRYWRMEASGRSYIGCQGRNVGENRAFCALSDHFSRASLPVPRVYGLSADGLCYLQDDIRGESLFDLRGDVSLLVKTIRLLPRFQFEGARNLDFDICWPQREFDSQMILFDQHYFKYCFLKPAGYDEFDEIALEKEFSAMRQRLLAADTGNTFLYRDFQARNVIIRDGEPWMIDFQGGRRGPVHYDLASFAWQARAGYTADLRARLVDEYLDAASPRLETSREEFLSTLRHFVLLRSLQVLGAYGFRGLFERKPHFLESIPYAMANLRELLQEPFAEYPYLSNLLSQLASMPRFALPEPAHEGLQVRVLSFSFRKGIPEDPSGNGGGYVFDCRGVVNPGRYEKFRQMDGRDAPVAEFLDASEDMQAFLGHVYALADAHVADYISRGFTDLMFCCGCTGGQHRSVYAAEHLAAHLRERFPSVKVTLCHRERDV